MYLGSRQFRIGTLSLAATGAILCATTVFAAGDDGRYQQDRAVCNSGRSQEDRATCLREAGAAREETSRGHLTNAGNAQYQENAQARCGALAGGDRDACQARMRGEGTVSGSVAGGGMLREIVTPDPK
jgi:hypothetical protein